MVLLLLLLLLLVLLLLILLRLCIRRGHGHGRRPASTLLMLLLLASFSTGVRRLTGALLLLRTNRVRRRGLRRGVLRRLAVRLWPRRGQPCGDNSRALTLLLWRVLLLVASSGRGTATGVVCGGRRRRIVVPIVGELWRLFRRVFHGWRSVGHFSTDVLSV